MIELKMYPKRKYLSEISQKVPFKFAFVNQNVVCHQFVKCRDFMQDVLRAQFDRKRFEIYGFEYDPATDPPLDLNKTTVAVRNISEKYVAHAIKLLTLFESEAGITEFSQAESTQKEKLWLFTSSKEWMSSPFTLSLYTFLIRLAYRKWSPKSRKEMSELIKTEIKSDNYYGDDNDAEYLKTVGGFIHNILPNRNLISWKEVDYSRYSINHYHNTSGICSLAQLEEGNKKLNTAKRIIRKGE